MVLVNVECFLVAVEVAVLLVATVSDMLGNVDKDLLETFAVVVVVDDDDDMEDSVGLVVIVVVVIVVVESSWLVPVLLSSSAASSFWKVVIVVVKERSKDLGDSRMWVGCCLVVWEPTVERVDDDDDDHGASAVRRGGVVVMALVSCGDVGRRMGEIS